MYTLVEMSGQLVHVSVFQTPCRAIKKIASSFNLTDELNVSLNGLVMEAKQLRSTQARENADRAIEELKAFISQLSLEPSGIAHLLASPCTAEIVLQNIHTCKSSIRTGFDH